MTFTFFSNYPSLHSCSMLLLYRQRRRTSGKVPARKFPRLPRVEVALDCSIGLLAFLVSSLTEFKLRWPYFWHPKTGRPTAPSVRGSGFGTPPDRRGSGVLPPREIVEILRSVWWALVHLLNRRWVTFNYFFSKSASEMTYIVSSGALNSTHSLTRDEGIFTERFYILPTCYLFNGHS